MEYREVTECRVCKSNRLTKYLDLGLIPLANAINKTPIGKFQAKYPLQVMLCEQCSLSQLSIIVDPKILYADYPYHSGVSSTFRQHCYDLGAKLKAMWDKQEKFHPQPNVLDIACNDGTLLKEFRKSGFLVNGVEPSNIEIPHEELIPVIRQFWSEKVASQYAVAFDFITATNVFAHVDDLDDFVRGVKLLLLPKGVFVVEVPYLMQMLVNRTFDTIYHEHLSYFTVRALNTLFERHGMTLFKVEQNGIHGGSIRCFVSKHKYDIDSSVNYLIRTEGLMGLGRIGEYLDFSEYCKELKRDLVNMFDICKSQNAKVMGYGATAKSTVLLNYCGITNDMIHSIVDETPDKQNKYTAGTDIPIVDFSHFEKEQPDFIVLLAWNFERELRQKTAHLNCLYIHPMPVVRVE